MSEQKEQVCKCYNEPDWPSPEFAKQQPICDEFTAMARDPYICERCEHNESCHIPQVNYRAHAEALAGSLQEVVRLSDRGHPTWQQAKDRLAAFGRDCSASASIEIEWDSFVPGTITILEDMPVSSGAAFDQDRGK